MFLNIKKHQLYKINKCMKVALIITGQLRFRNRDHLIDFKNKVDGFDIYISTYSKYKFHASKLSNSNRYLLHREKDIKVPMNNMLQWFHLNSIISRHSTELEKYDCIIKLRTDIDFINLNTLIHSIHSIDPNTIYSCTDIFFYANSRHFLKTFSGFWESIFDEYTNSSGLYKTINYRNILESADNLLETQEMGSRFTWLIVPKFIFSKNFNELKENIRENLKFLERLNNNKTRYNDFNNYRFDKINNIPFSSEQIFCLHSFSFGKVENSKIVIKLYGDRHLFNY
jgi:hypothetical protein